MITDEGEVREALALFQMKKSVMDKKLEDKTTDANERLKITIEWLQIIGKIKALKWILEI